MCTCPTLYLDLGGGGDPAPQRCRERGISYGLGSDRWRFIIRRLSFRPLSRANPLAPRDTELGGRGLGRKGAKGKGGVGVATESFRSESCRRAFPNPYGPQAVNK